MMAGDRLAAVAASDKEAAAVEQLTLWLTESIARIIAERTGSESARGAAERLAGAALGGFESKARAKLALLVAENPNLCGELGRRLMPEPGAQALELMAINAIDCSAVGTSASPVASIDRLAEVCREAILSEIDAADQLGGTNVLDSTKSTGAEVTRRRVKEALVEDLREAVEGPRLVRTLKRLAQECGQTIDDLRHTLFAGDLFEQGLQDFIDGKFYEASEAFCQIASTREAQNLRSAAEAYLFQGNALICLGQHAQAVEVFAKCLGLGLTSAIAWNDQGIALMGAGRVAEAIASFDRAIEIRKDYALAWCHRGRARARHDDHEGALEQYKAALRFDPNYHRTWYNRGRSLAALRRYEEAVENYETAIQIYGRDPAVWYARGNVLFRLQRYEEAIASYDRTLALDRTHSFSLTNRGVALAIVGWEEAALGSFEKALEIDPSYPRAWYNRGVVLQRLGQLAAARASIEQFLSRAAPGSASREAAKKLLEQLNQSPA